MRDWTALNLDASGLQIFIKTAHTTIPKNYNICEEFTSKHGFFWQIMLWLTTSNSQQADHLSKHGWLGHSRFIIQHWRFQKGPEKDHWSNQGSRTGYLYLLDQFRIWEPLTTNHDYHNLIDGETKFPLSLDLQRRNAATLDLLCFMIVSDSNQSVEIQVHQTKIKPAHWHAYHNQFISKLFW